MAVLLVTDALCAAAAVFVGWAVKYGIPDGDLDIRAYIWWSCLLGAGWLWCLAATNAYQVRRIGAGAREFQRVLRAAVTMGASVAIVGYLTGIAPARMFLAIVLPTGMALMVLSRFAVRKAVHRRRVRGEFTSHILAVGTRETVTHLTRVLRRTPQSGLVVVGACIEDGEPGDLLDGDVPVVGAVPAAAELATDLGVDVVAVAGAGLGPRRVRELGWALEGSGCAMVMAPNLTEVAGPRVHVSPVEGVPLMWVDQPQFSGGRRAVKRAADVLASLVLLALASPLLIVIALGVRLTSRGPALYRSERLGEHGTPFTVHKFRSMHLGADRRRTALLDRNEVVGGTLFKIRRDPRVTPFGRLLRKFSLDELPQLFNVLLGTMSLVGPRPPLRDEVERYGPHVRRRLLVKPGMTGLWQVSGRSDLSWEESVRLDLYYVENWSLGLDIMIIARTVWVVLRGRGAY
ncbi:MAG: sugar transferase [Jatrophihabitans sp.]|nr:MAG: sugar transferase [Jatrophihabitans sp.]